MAITPDAVELERAAEARASTARLLGMNRHARRSARSYRDLKLEARVKLLERELKRLQRVVLERDEAYEDLEVDDVADLDDEYDDE